jgi:hypothetical protein
VEPAVRGEVRSHLHRLRQRQVGGADAGGHTAEVGGCRGLPVCVSCSAVWQNSGEQLQICCCILCWSVSLLPSPLSFSPFSSCLQLCCSLEQLCDGVSILSVCGVPGALGRLGAPGGPRGESGRVRRRHSLGAYRVAAAGERKQAEQVLACMKGICAHAARLRSHSMGVPRRGGWRGGMQQARHAARTAQGGHILAGRG